MSQPSFSGSSMHQASQNEYKAAIQYLQTQYQRAQKKLAQREHQLQIALGKGKSLESIRSFQHIRDNFQLQNQPFEFKSQINQLKYKHLAEKDQMMIHHQKEIGIIVQEYEYKMDSEIQRHKHEIGELINQIETRNSLIRELETKPVQMMKELVELGRRSDEQQEQNLVLKDMIKGMTRELEVFKGENKYKKENTLDQLEQVKKQNHRLQQQNANQKRTVEDNQNEINRLKAEIVNIKVQSQKLMMLNKDKLYYANQQVERYKKLLQTYKALNADKQTQIRKLSEQLMNIQLQKSKKIELANLDQDKNIQKLQGKIKQLTEQLGAKQLNLKQIAFKNQQEINVLKQQIRDKEEDGVAKIKDIEKWKESNESKQNEIKKYRLRQQQLLEQIKQKKNNLLLKQQQILQLKLQLKKESQNYQLEDKINSLHTQLSNKQRQLEQSHQKIKLLNKQKKSQSIESANQQRIKQSYDNLQFEYNQLKQKLIKSNDLQHELQEKQISIRSLTKQNKILTDSKKKVQDNLTELQKAARQLKYQNQNLKQILEAGSVSGSSTYKDQNQNLSRLNSALRQDVAREKTKAKTKQQELVVTKSQLNKAIHQKQIVLIRVSQLEREKQELQKKVHTQKDYFKGQIAKQISVIQSLRKNIHQANNNNLVLTSNLEQTISTNLIIKNDLQLQKTRLKQMQSLKRKHQLSQQSIKITNDKLSKEIHQIQMDYQQKQQTIKSVQRSQQLQKQKALAKIKKLETQLQVKKTLEDELCVANQKIAELERNVYHEVEKNTFKSIDIRKKTSQQVGMSPEVAKYKVEIEELMKENEELYMKLDSTERVLETIRKQLLGYRKQFNVLNNSEEQKKEKIEQQQQQINQAKILIESLKRQKNTLTNQKRRQSLSFQDRISQMTHQNQQLNKQKQRLQLQITKLKTNFSNASKDYRKVQNTTQQQLQILKVQRDDLEDKFHQISKAKSLQQLKTKKLNQQITNLKNQQLHLQQQFEKVNIQCYNQKTKNTKQIKSFQQLIEKMNDQLLSEKKQYQVKNAMIFKNQTNLYNQVNNAHQQIDKLNQQKQQLIERINKLIESNNNMESTLLKNTKDNVRLREQIRVVESSQRQEEARRDKSEDRFKDSRTRMINVKQSRQQQMVTELENKFKQVQQMKYRLKTETDYSHKQKPTEVLQMKVEYSQLLNEYNRLQDKYQQLELLHTQLTIEYEKYKRKTTKEIFEAKINDSEDIRNLREQVDILNNILMEKDKQIETLKKISAKGYTKYQPPSYQYYTKSYTDYPTYGLQSGRELVSKTDIKDYQKMYSHQIPSQEIIVSTRDIYPSKPI